MRPATPPPSAIVLGAVTLAASLLVTPAAVARADVGRGTPPAPATQQWPLDAGHFNANRIWPLSQGAGVTVAVVDSGVDAHHPDLSGQVLPGIDLTGHNVDGRVDISPNSHGTSVAAVIAGTGHGAQGNAVLGLAPKATILPVRVADGDATTPPLLAQGIAYAAEHGAQVINVSSGTAVDNPQVRQAVAAAQHAGAIVVAATGNDGTGGNPTTYPAAIPGVIAVAGTDRTGSFWPQSGWGAYVALAAPAVGIYSADDQGSYVTANGTSYAAPYVSATVALLRAKYPTESTSQIINRLLATADPVPGSRSDHVGHGLVDPYRALTAPSFPATAANPLLTPSAQPASQSQLPLVATIAGGVLLLLALAGTTVYLRRRRGTKAVSRPQRAPVPRSGSGRSRRPAPRRKGR